MTAELTPWFNGTVKPARPGVYEREFSMCILYAEWTGVQWLCGRRTVHTASKERNVSYLQNRVRWRGLAKAPK